jgi:pimeloyl-ACP methyl ester carboxylesterase
VTTIETPTEKPPSSTEAERRPRRITRLILRIGAGVLVLVGVAVALGAVYQMGASWRDSRNHPAAGVLVEIDGHRLHLHCQGSGSPTVVFESGLGGFSHDWSHLQPDLATTTRVCSYDRAGYGWSDDVAEPKTSAQTARDLHTLLGSAGEDGPFVLVGHSLGGLHVRSFAQLFPDEVAGMVLVDSAHEQQATRLAMLAPLDDVQSSGLTLCRRLAPLGIPRLLGIHDEAIPDSLSIPPEVESAWASRLYQNRFCATVSDEFTAIQVETSRPESPEHLGDLPLTVLTSDRDLTVDQEPVAGITIADLAAANRVAGDLQAELAALSTDSVHRVVPDAGHYIHWDQPAVVLDSIDEVIAYWRLSQQADGEVRRRGNG